MAEFTLIDSGGWVAAAPASTLAVPYPAAAADGGASANDRIYMLLHTKPDSVAPTPSGSWTLAEEVTGGSGTVGGGTGPTRWSVYYRSVPGGGLTTTTPVTITGASVAQGAMVQLRPDSGAVTWSHDVVNGSITSSTTDLACTATSAPSGGIADDDHVIVLVGAPDDAETDQAVATIVASGATIGTPAQPVNSTTSLAIGTNSSSLGNDAAATIWDAEVTAGSSSAAPSITGTGSSGETRHVAWLVVKAAASGDTTGVFAGTAPEASGALTGSETITGATAGTAPEASGALTGAETFSGTLAASAPEATGALTGTETIPAAFAGTSPEASGALTGTETISGTFAGSAPEAVGSLTGDIEGVVGGSFAGTAPEAVGALTGTETISGAFAATSPAAVGALVAGEESAAPTLPLRVGAPSKPPGLRAGTPTKDAGLSVGTPS
jgi:hypothetical protein